MSKNRRLAIRSGLTIGDLAARTGLAVSAIRYYEAEGLVHPWRNAGGQRRFERADIRRLSFVMVAQKFGFTIARIREVMQGLPDQRTPTAADWRRISTGFRADLDQQIAALEQMRDKLDGCIGCGCLSMKACTLYNESDQAQHYGAGPRYLMGDPAPEAGAD
ncbi:redox-sensitive transcriptional activator SoxR [Thalassobius sp. Cn5-15]|uniref:redox-sensitive transcriptional activator SoxR n=1 Tax=Thalassobius sp. Cn5-15 TaxID=2917763 RepID=UPI001EF22C83|nr:redox-sensitive transcriptional activator SoxR [Thalassobius sp. Cn5-15]MCG7493405.1 redox-sensitive transcriptional activator SoxR [Thalassobius sp. Cn5-15]